MTRDECDGNNALDIVRAHAAASPIAQWLSFSVENDANGRLYCLGFDDRHIGNPAIRALHGGAIGAFLEFCAECELAALAGAGTDLQIVSIAIDYLRSSRPENMSARVTLDRKGRRISVLEAKGWQADEDRPVAIARACVRTSTEQG